MMSERLRSRDPKSNTTKSYTMFFEDENKYNSVNSGSSSSGNNNSANSSDSNNLNNNLKKFLKKQMNLNNNNDDGVGVSSGSIGDMDNDEKLNREQFFENFQTEQNLAAVMENGRKRKYDKIKEEENNGSNSNNNNTSKCSGNELDEDNQKQQQQQQNNNENQHTNDELNENLNERNFNEENLNENIDENDAKKTKLDNNSYHSNNNNNHIESQALINRNLQRLLHHPNDEDEEEVDNDLESVATGDIPQLEQKDIISNDTINIPTTANLSSINANTYTSAALNNSAYLESLEIIKKIKYDDTRELMYQVYQPWVLQTYGDSAKTKTITMKKQERIIKTLTGQETNNPDSSKFRFWVKSKGFTTEKPKEFKEIEIDRTNLSNEQRLEDKNVCLLYVPNFSKDSTAQPYRKVAVVEYFFDIIFEVHVGLGGRSGRHAGQKRTYRTISESYAFLPREAVTKFLSGCILCRKFPIRTFTTFTSKFLEEQLTDSSTEFVENSPKSELSGNTENVNNNSNINNNNDDKKLHENDNKILNNDNNNSSNNNGNNNNNTTSNSKDNDDGVKLSVDWEEEINMETSKSNEKKFVSNINNINSKIENDLLNELNENFFLSASSAAAAAAAAGDDKNCIKNITITNELVTYYHLLKQFYEQQHHMKVNPMPVSQSPPVCSSSSSASSSTVATANITTKTENDVVNLMQQQQQQNLRQIRLPQKSLMEDYKNLPLIMSTLSQSFKQNDLLLQVQQASQTSSAIPNPQSLIDLTITKSPSPQPVEIKSPQLSPKPDQPINNININMKNFDNLSINVSTNIDKNKVKILCNTTPPKKRYNNFFTTNTPTSLTPTISNTISSPSPSSVSSSLSSTLSSGSILNDNINFMNNLLLNNNNNNNSNNNNNNSGGGGGGGSSSNNNDNTASNNLIFKQKNEKIENIIKKCEMKNQQQNNNSGNNHNNSSSNNVFQINPITSTYLNMTRSMGLSDDDALKFDELGVKMFCDETVTTVSDVSENHVDDPYAGVMKDADKLKLMLLAWNYQNSAAVRNGTEGPDLAAVSGLWAQYQNALAMQAAAVKPPTSPVKLDSPIETQDETNSSGQKDDDDLSDDDLDDRLDQTPHDPERLKAFNMFVRLFVDENLDRMVPISKQPKEKIQAIIDSCTRQFPEFAERSRKRIRTYLKSCRRNKKARDGWETSSRPTPAHLTSVQAEQILASACDNESMNAKRMRMGMEPISQAVSPSLINPIETTVTPSSYMSSILKTTNNTDTLTMPSISTLGKPSPSSSVSTSSISVNSLSDVKNLSATITSSASLNNNLMGGGGSINGQSILNNNNLNSNSSSSSGCGGNNNINNSNNKIPNNNNNNNNKLIPPPSALYRNEFSKPNNTNYPSGSGGGSGGGGGGNNSNTNNNNGQGSSMGVNMNASISNGRSNTSMPPPSSTPTQPTYPTFISHSSTSSNANNNNNNTNNISGSSSGNNNNNNANLIAGKSSTNGPTDLSMKQLKPPLLAHKLNASELDAVRQLVTGYRESAAFLLRSADELEQLLLSQQQ